MAVAVLLHATVEASGPCVISIETVLAVFVVFEIDAVYADVVPVAVSARATEATRPAAVRSQPVRTEARGTIVECLPTTAPSGREREREGL